MLDDGNALHPVQPVRPGPVARPDDPSRWRPKQWVLLALAYCDAFRQEPRKVLTAIKWRILGKRLRARGQLAPLLHLSPYAYRLWMARRERIRHHAPLGQLAEPEILALIDAMGDVDANHLAQTREMLRQQGIPSVVVGPPPHTSCADVAASMPRDAASWLLLMQPGDVLSHSAIDQYRVAIANNQAAVLYADDDLIGPGTQRGEPHFKPGWNAPLFEHFDYITGSCIVRARRKDLLRVTGRVTWASDLVAGILATDSLPPCHLPAVLHHRRLRPSPRLPAMPLKREAGLPSVTVIVPTRNRVDLLRPCLQGLAATRYSRLDIIVVDNGSDDPATLAYLDSLDRASHQVLRHDGPFNYPAINNRAVRNAQGELLCLLNNDIEIIDPEWLATMATSALRRDVGAVGARLLYPDGRIQHAGVVLGIGGAAAHAHRLLHPDETGYFSRHNLPQFVSAVTAACLVVDRAKFVAAGMLDEVAFPVAFNDVDLCLRLNQRGWQSFYEPRATLIHHESVSRGHDRDPVGAARLERELAALRQRWGTDRMVDPFHHPELSRESERFAIAL